MLSVKTKEHIRRRLLGVLPKYGTLLGGLAALGCMVVFTGNLVRVVTITDSRGQQGRVITAAQDMEALFRQTGVTPDGEQDEMLITEQVNGDEIHVLRAYTVPLTVDGNTVTVVVTGGTVADALQKAGVSVSKDDIVTPALNEPTTEGGAITVERVVYEDFTQAEVLPIETEYRYSSLFYRSQKYQQTMRTGSEGLAQVSYRNIYRDGKLIDTAETGRVVEVEMVPTLIKCYGAGAEISQFQGPEIVDGKPAEGVAAVYTGKRATGYSASATAKGASGRRLTYGTVAVNPNIIPYGSLMYITSDDGNIVYGYAYAADTGTAMMQGVAFIDLYYETYDESVKNAVFNVSVYVLDRETAAKYKDTNDALLAADTTPGL